MFKKITLSSLAFCLSFSLFGQDPSGIWSRLEIDIPLSSNYTIMTELCGKLYVQIGSDIFVSEDAGLTWNPILDEDNLSGHLYENGFFKLIEETEQISVNIVEGQYYLYGLNCENDEAELTYTESIDRYIHGCNNFIHMYYLHGQFVMRRHQICQTSGLSYREVKSSANSIDYETQCYYTPDNEENCFVDTITDYFNGIYQNYTSDYTGLNYYLSQTGNAEETLLENAVGAVYLDEKYYYNTGNDIIYFRDLADNIWETSNVGISNIKAFGEANQSLFLATENKIFLNTAVDNNSFNFTEVADITNTTGLTIKDIDFFQDIFFIKTNEGSVIRMDISGINLASPEIVDALRPYNFLHSNGENIYLNGTIFPSMQKLVNNDSLVTINDAFSTIENAFLNEECPDYELKLLSSSQNYLLKSTDNINWDTILTRPAGKTNFIKKNNHLLLIEEDAFVSYSDDDGITWDNIQLLGGNYTYQDFAIDENGTWITQLDTLNTYWGSKVYSIDNGETWLSAGEGEINAQPSIFALENGIYFHHSFSNYAWNADSLQFILANTQETEGLLSYYSDSYQVGSHHQILQRNNSEGVYLFGEDPLSFVSLDLPFTTSFYYQNLAGGNYETVNPHRAKKYVFLENTVYALTDQGVWYADICDLWQPEIYEELSFCEGDSVLINNEAFYDAQVIEYIEPTLSACEKTFIYDLTVLPAAIITENIEVIVGDEFEGQIITNDTVITTILDIPAGNGCDSILVQNISANISNIDDLQTSNDLLLFPNPVKNQLNLSFSHPTQEDIHIEIFNLMGQRVSKSHYFIPAGDMNYQINTSDLFTGIYFLNLSNPNFKITQKFVK